MERADISRLAACPSKLQAEVMSTRHIRATALPSHLVLCSSVPIAETEGSRLTLQEVIYIFPT